MKKTPCITSESFPVPYRHSSQRHHAQISTGHLSFLLPGPPSMLLHSPPYRAAAPMSWLSEIHLLEKLVSCLFFFSSFLAQLSIPQAPALSALFKALHSSSVHLLHLQPRSAWCGHWINTRLLH